MRSSLQHIRSGPLLAQEKLVFTPSSNIVPISSSSLPINITTAHFELKTSPLYAKGVVIEFVASDYLL